MVTLQVRAHWDGEAGVWWAESSDVPGLVTEADSRDELAENVRHLVPDLLIANGDGSRRGQIVFSIDFDRVEEIVDI